MATNEGSSSGNDHDADRQRQPWRDEGVANADKARWPT